MEQLIVQDLENKANSNEFAYELQETQNYLQSLTDEEFDRLWARLESE